MDRLDLVDIIDTVFLHHTDQFVEVVVLLAVRGSATLALGGHDRSCRHC